MQLIDWEFLKQTIFSKNGGWKNPIEPLYEVKFNKSRSKSFVDFQHDVTCDDVRLAHREDLFQ